MKGNVAAGKRPHQPMVEHTLISLSGFSRNNIETTTTYTATFTYMAIFNCIESL